MGVRTFCFGTDREGEDDMGREIEMKFLVRGDAVAVHGAG
jgi:hypothetical protein